MVARRAVAVEVSGSKPGCCRAFFCTRFSPGLLPSVIKGSRSRGGFLSPKQSCLSHSDKRREGPDNTRPHNDMTGTDMSGDIRQMCGRIASHCKAERVSNPTRNNSTWKATITENLMRSLWRAIWSNIRLTIRPHDNGWIVWWVDYMRFLTWLFARNYWFPVFLTKAWPTDKGTAEPTDGPTDPLIDMWRRI